MAMSDVTLWTSRPSQYVLLPYVALCSGLFLAIAGSVIFNPQSRALEVTPILLGIVLFSFYKYLQNRSTSYRLTKEQFVIKTGVFNVNHEFINLYKFNDVNIHQPWWHRPFGIAQLRLVSSDRMTPVVLIDGIRDVESVRATFREYWMTERGKNRVYTMD